VVSVALTGGDEAGGDETGGDEVTQEAPLLTRRSSQEHATAASPLCSLACALLTHVSASLTLASADCCVWCACVSSACVSSAVAVSAVAAMAMNLEAERARQAKVAAPQQAKLEKKRYMDALRYLSASNTHSPMSPTTHCRMS
jgi:hypothetical protein